MNFMRVSRSARLTESLDSDNGGKCDRAVHVRECFRGVAELLVDQRHVQFGFVDVQQEQRGGVAIEPFDNPAPLIRGAAVDEALVL